PNESRTILIRNQLFSDDEAGRVSPLDFAAVLGPSSDTFSDGRLPPTAGEAGLFREGAAKWTCRDGRRACELTGNRKFGLAQQAGQDRREGWQPPQLFRRPARSGQAGFKLARRRRKGERLSLREISTALADAGHTSSNGSPFTATSVQRMPSQ